MKKIAKFKQGQHSTVIIVISILRRICIQLQIIGRPRAYNGGFCGKKNKVIEELERAYYNRETVVIGIKVCRVMQTKIDAAETNTLWHFRHTLQVQKPVIIDSFLWLSGTGMTSTIL